MKQSKCIIWLSLSVMILAGAALVLSVGCGKDMSFGRTEAPAVAPAGTPLQAPAETPAKTPAVTERNAPPSVTAVPVRGEAKRAEKEVMDMRSLAKCRKKMDCSMPVATARAPMVMENPGVEDYAEIRENGFRQVSDHPLSTFSIDVDTASYSNMRRFLSRNSLPPKDAVRIEEMINYFSYDYAPPQDDKPFATHVEVASCPWAENHRLVRVGIKGKDIAQDKRPASNLVFLLDVSGSMGRHNKLPYVKKSLRLLLEKLGENDRVAIVVYAGASGLVLPSTTCDKKSVIMQAMDNLRSGGSTNGGAGIELAYKTAIANFIKGGTNRVILCTDGDFNVGTTSRGDLTRLIEEKAKSGVFLSVLGFGMGNYKDSTLERLADKGNGNYGYIDTLNEARKIFVQQMTGTLITIAKDVKIQIEFNPRVVDSYRLIGYENRMLKKEDFNNDKVDAGDIGAGHTVTALYEVVPLGMGKDSSNVDPLKYQTKPSDNLSEDAYSGEMLTLKLCYKAPDGDTSKLLTFPVEDKGLEFTKTSADFHWSAAVAGFGMLLRDSKHAGTTSFDSILKMANAGKGKDAFGYRKECIQLMQSAKNLKKTHLAVR